MILSARDLKVRGVLCALRFVRVVDFSMSHGGRSECGMPRLVASAPGLPLSVTLTGVCDGVDLASPSIKRNLNICQGTVDDAVGLFQNITNATLIILEVENDSTMSCKETYHFAWPRPCVCTPQTYYYTDLNYEFEVGILSRDWIIPGLNSKLKLIVCCLLFVTFCGYAITI